MASNELDQEQDKDLEETVLFAQLRDAGRELGDWLGTYCRMHGPEWFDIPADLSDEQWKTFLRSTEQLLPHAFGGLLSELGANGRPLSEEDRGRAKRLVRLAYELAAVLRDADDSRSMRHARWEREHPEVAAARRSIG